MRKRWMRPTGNWRPALTEREVGFFLSPPFMVPLAPLPERPLPERPLAPLPDMFICVLGGGTCGEARVFVFGKRARQPGFGWSSAFKSAPSHTRRDGLITRKTPKLPQLVHDFGGANERAESRFVSAIFPESTVNTFEIGTSVVRPFWISHFVAPRRPHRTDMAVKMTRRITQEAFDECVQGNIDDFEMEPDEAVEEAVKEFELQGVDLSQIDKTYAGPDGRGEHPAAAAARAHDAAVEEGDLRGIADTARALRECVSGEGATPGWGSACVGAGAVQACWRACERVADGSAGASSDDVADAMQTLALVLSCDEGRDTFVSLRHPMNFVAALWPAFASTHPKSVAECCAVVAAACTRNEACKGAFIKAGVETPLVAVFVDAASDAHALRHACAAVKALTTGDDPREPASGAFTHARAFAKAGAASALCVSLTRVDASEDPGLCASLAAALKHVAVNDDICKEIAERGGVARLLELLPAGCAAGDAKLARACAACLRQLAGSDGNKSLIVNAGGLAVLTHVVNVFGARAGDATCGDADANRFHSVQEQCVGCLAALLLKNPEGAARCGAEGVFEPVVDAMSRARAHKGLQRQCAMFLRNAVVRTPENVPLILNNTDAEALLRLSKKNHPKECVDVASAAMRDLGCDNYNEGWRPTTAVMGADGVVRTPEELGDEPVGVNGPIPEDDE